MNIKLYYDGCESNIAIGILGSKEDIELQLNSFYNFGATNQPELHWMNENPVDKNKAFAYIWTDDKKLKKYFRNSSAAMLYENKKVEELKEEYKHFKGKKGSGAGASKVIKEMCEKRYNAMIRENFLPEVKKYHIYRTVGQIEESLN